MIALRVLNMPAIERKLYRRYLKAKTAHRPKLPALSGLEAEIVEGLRRDGLFVTTLAALGIDRTRRMVRSADSLVQRYSQRVRAGAFRFRDTISASAHEIMAHPDIFHWGCDAALLRIVESYVELPVAYDSMALYYTVADALQKGTRLWHRDREDRAVVKIAVYLNDVGPDGGPLQVMRRDVPQRPGLCPFDYPVLTHEKLQRRLGFAPTDKEMAELTGPAGTVIFCDTAKYYHRGKPPTRHDRGALFYCYFSQQPRHPFLCERSGLSRAHIAQLSQAYDAPKRDSARWFARLPWPARLVPRSLV